MSFRLERDCVFADGLVTIRRVVQADGAFVEHGAFVDASRVHIWRRTYAENHEAFLRRTIEEATWLALRRSAPVTLHPVHE